jgi:hypothetical protein
VSQQPTCNLCKDPWLFVISLGGRTGSTTILSTLDAHPLVRLAGENNGQMATAAQMWAEAAATGYRTNSTTQGRGNLQPYDLLCDLQSWFETSSTPVYTSTSSLPIRGFKDISWTPESMAMLDILFPCNRKVFSVRANETA